MQQVGVDPTTFSLATRYSTVELLLQLLDKRDENQREEWYTGSNRRPCRRPGSRTLLLIMSKIRSNPNLHYVSCGIDRERSGNLSGASRVLSQIELRPHIMFFTMTVCTQDYAFVNFSSYLLPTITTLNHFRDSLSLPTYMVKV